MRRGTVRLSDVADELYGLPPDEFIAARDARRKEARADGERELAKAIGKLRKPSTAGWVVNMLVRRQPDELRQLVALGSGLREAQRDLEGEQLKELTRQRRQVVMALTRQARSLAQELGRPVSDAVAGQVQETLRAAVAEESAGRSTLSGRLTSPLSYSGVGTADVRGSVATVPSGEDDAPAAGDEATTDGRTSRHDQRRRAAQQQLAGAREELADAETAAAEAESDAERERDALDRLGPGRRLPDLCRPPLRLPSTRPAGRVGGMRVLVAGWFSFDEVVATIGDELGADTVVGWLTDLDVPFDVAEAPYLGSGVDWREVDPAD